jgi:drug/metabolite transporter (DMT)-like permease
MIHSNTRPRSGFLYSFGGVALISTNFVTAKYGLMGFNPETFSFIWTTAAAVYAFIIALSIKASRDQIYPKKSIKAMVGLGTSTGVSMVLTWSGLACLNPVLSSLIWRFYPVLTMLSGVLFLKEKLSRVEIIAVMIMLMGSLISLAGRWEIVGKGVIFTILAAFTGALQLLIAKTQADKVHPNILVAYRVGIGAVVTAVWAFSSGKAEFDVEARYWLITLAGAFLGPCASFLLTFRSYRYWSLSQSSMVLTIQPLLVLPLAYIFLGSLPTIKELAGGAVILAGAFWLAWIHISKADNTPQKTQ